MTKPFRPNLAATAPADLNELSFPLLASAKLDGVRAIVIDCVVYSRSMKPIPNKHVQQLFGQPEYNGFDGELIVGHPAAKDVFKITTSGVMSHEGTPDVTFHVFDNIIVPEAHYIARLNMLSEIFMYVIGRPSNVVLVRPETVNNVFELSDYENRIVSAGYEGVMLRKPDAFYKQGRSTLKEGGLIKLKRFTDTEGEIVGMIPLRHNRNSQEVSEIGLAKRSTKKAGKVESNELMGALVVRMADGTEVEVGSGFTETERKVFFVDWQNVAKSALLKFKYFEPGTDKKPRHPVYVGLRAREDL